MVVFSKNRKHFKFLLAANLFGFNLYISIAKWLKHWNKYQGHGIEHVCIDLRLSFLGLLKDIYLKELNTYLIILFGYFLPAQNIFM